MSPRSQEEPTNDSPRSESPPRGSPPRRGGFRHGGKRVRNSDRTVYEKTNFSRQPHPTILKRITWQDVLGGPYIRLPESERRRVANLIRAVARNLAQLMIVNNSTPPIYSDMETCTISESPWVPDFFESERDWRPSVSKMEMSRYLASRFPDILTTVKDGRSGSTQTLLPWVPQLILQNAYQRYARGVRLFYSREVASQETYSFGDIIVGALKSFTSNNTVSYALPVNNVGVVEPSALRSEMPPGYEQDKLHEMLASHPPKQELRLKRTLALKREETQERATEQEHSSPQEHIDWESDNGTNNTFNGQHFSPRSSFSSTLTYVKEEPDHIMSEAEPISCGALWPEDPEA